MCPFPPSVLAGSGSQEEGTSPTLTERHTTGEGEWEKHFNRDYHWQFTKDEISTHSGSHTTGKCDTEMDYRKNLCMH